MMGRIMAATALKLDELDRRILDFLQEDGRLSYRQIAGVLGVSVSTVSERVRKMYEGGVIKRFTVLLDPEELGLDCSVALLIKVSPGYDPAEVGERIAIISKTCYVYQITGEFHILVISRTNVKKEAQELLKRITKVKGVESINSSWILQTIKESPLKVMSLGGKIHGD
jgi:Lrp/AsnC family transcriptional regulator for asnA, asnC and gidA